METGKPNLTWQHNNATSYIKKTRKISLI